LFQPQLPTKGINLPPCLSAGPQQATPQAALLLKPLSGCWLDACASRMPWYGLLLVVVLLLLLQCLAAGAQSAATPPLPGCLQCCRLPERL